MVTPEPEISQDAAPAVKKHCMEYGLSNTSTMIKDATFMDKENCAVVCGGALHLRATVNRTVNEPTVLFSSL